MIPELEEEGEGEIADTGVTYSSGPIALLNVDSEPFDGTIGRYFWESTPSWPEPVRPSPEAPNVLILLLDDVGFAQLGCFGSQIDTPVMDGLAANGLRYSNFHTTGLCSPTRSCVLTGRNHHSNGMGRITDLATGFPGYSGRIPRSNGFLSQILVERGYATFAVGKWHLTPDEDMHLAAPRTSWPLGRGFERFYGFHGGETHQFAPWLVHDNHFVEQPRSIKEGYHLTEDLVDHAIEECASSQHNSTSFNPIAIAQNDATADPVNQDQVFHRGAEDVQIVLPGQK